MQLHDSLTKESKEFPPEAGRPVLMYACGPTVYHYVHIGNLRTFATVDLLRRYATHRGHEVKLVMNITDVGHMLNDADTGDDRMDVAAAREGKTPEEVAAFYSAAFFQDMQAIGNMPATLYPKATDHIPQMVAMIEKLLTAGKAYVTGKGDIYYSVASFPEYGKLSGNTVDKLVAGARVEVKEDKRHPADFALWINNSHHVMQWTGPQGIQGYPGWHIECSAMAGQHLGATIGLHAGGEDLKFPHHECEIAQSEGANGVTFARHWLHVTYLLVDGEKMSKSKGNFYTLSDLTAKGYSPTAVRWLLLSAHYRTQLNFTLAGLDAAEKTMAYYRGLYARLMDVAGGTCTFQAVEAMNEFDRAMDDDLNVSKALAVVHEFAKKANRDMDAGTLTGAEASFACGFLYEALTVVFGLDLTPLAMETPAAVRSLADERQVARARKDWKESDRLRDAIAGMGWVVEDAPDGYKLKKA